MLHFDYDGFMLDISRATSAKEVGNIFASLTLLTPADYKAAIAEIEKGFVDDWQAERKLMGDSLIDLMTRKCKEDLAQGPFKGNAADRLESQMRIQFIDSLYQARGDAAHPLLRLHANEIAKLSQDDKDLACGMTQVFVGVWDQVKKISSAKTPKFPNLPSMN